MLPPPLPVVSRGDGGAVPEPEVAAFLSYVHADDAAEGGRIVRIAEDVCSQYELTTGERLTIFLDRRDIGWGQDWRHTIDTVLASVAFFIPVVTPRYFRSTQCRREFELFTRHPQQLGVQRLVLPVRYIDFSDLHVERPADPLLAASLAYQWEDWTELRLEAPESPRYRAATTRMAASLAAARSAPSHGPAAARPPGSPGETVDDLLRRELRAVHEIVDDVRALVDRAARASEAAATAWSTGLMARLFLLETLADDVLPSVSEVPARVQRVNRALADLEPALLAAFGGATHGVRPAGERELVQGRERRGDLVGEVAAAMSDGVAGLGQLVTALERVEELSEGLRRGLAGLRESLAVQADGYERVRRWLRVAVPAASGADAAS